MKQFELRSMTVPEDASIYFELLVKNIGGN
jgi:hypothetical protein